MSSWGDCFVSQSLRLERSGDDVEQVLKAVRTACGKEETRFMVEFAVDSVEEDGSSRMSNRTFRAAFDRILLRLNEQARLNILSQRASRNSGVKRQ